MTSYHLPIFRSNSKEEIDETQSRAGDGRLDFYEVLDYCRHFRIVGICALLMERDTNEFQNYLAQGGVAFANFVRASSGRKETIVSKCVPFFDAIAAGDWRCAQKMATQMVGIDWRDTEEYEDDYLYMIMLAHHIGGSQNPIIYEILDRFDELSSEKPNPRLSICKALNAGESLDFSEALAELLDDYRDYFSRLTQAESIAPEVAATEGKVCVEGVALVQLGKKKGMDLEDDYLFVPSAALKPLREMPAS